MVRRYRVKVNDKEYIVEVEELSGVKVENEKVQTVQVKTEEPVKKEAPKVVEKEKEEIKSTGGLKEIKAPMAGVVVKLLVAAGDEVKSGDTVLIFEAMKMENELKSEYSGKIKKVYVKEGDSIETGQVLMVVE